MSFLRRLPALLALLVLGALGLRVGLPFLLALPLVLGLAGLAFLPRPWAPRLLATALGGGTLAWLAMAGLRVQQRLALGLPWTRLLLIFLAVATFTAWAAWLLRPRRA